MFTVRSKKLVSLITSALLLVGISVFGAALPAAAYSCDINFSGDGTQGNPWQIATSDQLDCFAAGQAWVPAGGGEAYFIQTADVIRDVNIPIHANSGAAHFHYDGQGHTVSIDNVTNFTGLFMNMGGDEVKNLTVSSNNSTLANQAGWFAGQDTGSVFTNVHSDGPIATQAGGIVGVATGSTISNSSSSGFIANDSGGLVGRGTNVTITGSFSTGLIGQWAGGLVGNNSQGGTISNSYSTGLIQANGGGIAGENATNIVLTNVYSTGLISQNAGGIVGANSTGVTVSFSYSLGDIETDAGGIVGANSSLVTVTNVYSAGSIAPDGGGIVGSAAGSPTVTNAYSSQGAIFGAVPFSETVTTSISGSGPFNASLAWTVLSPVSAWAQCSSVQSVGFYLTAITAVNPCAPSADPVSPTLAATGSNSSPWLLGGMLSVLAGGVILLQRKRAKVQSN